jgi:hypothetical protein
MLSSSGEINNPSALRNSSESSRALGSSIAHKAGSQTTAIGNNVVATTATASLTTGSVDTLGRSMGSESTAFPSWLLAGTRASSTVAIGLVPVDPWPEYWANNWYDTDDVYVTYADNGYYLFNRRYPNVGIAISISM